MDVLHRPHVPRLLSVTIAAAILACALSLALASRLGYLTQPGGDHGTLTGHTGSPQRALPSNAPPWAKDPFAGLSSRPLRAPRLNARR